MQQDKKKNKKKVVTFRLTENDLNQYESFCIDEQIRMSDFIRTALQNKVTEFYESMPVVRFVTENGSKTV